MIIELYAHTSKEAAWEAAEKAGLTDDALRMACYLGSEVKLKYQVDPATGEGILIAVDDVPLPQPE